MCDIGRHHRNPHLRHRQPAERYWCGIRNVRQSDQNPRSGRRRTRISSASFYVDNQIAVQKQNGETTNNFYDPSGRTEETVSEGTTKAAVIDHYAGPGEAISWTSGEEGKKWTRNIPGIDGTLGAEKMVKSAAERSGRRRENRGAEESGGLERRSPAAAAGFGVQVNGTPPTKYSWLGASGLATEPASAAIASAGSSYVPQLGRELQTQPVAPPGSPNGSYISPYIRLRRHKRSNSRIRGRSTDTRSGTPESGPGTVGQRPSNLVPPGVVPSPGEGAPGPLGGSEG